MALDFEKAFLNGNIKRDVCIVLPPEDTRSNGGLNVGYLRKAMYGLREAPAIWQEVVQNLMEQLGFVACVTMPCVYFHPGRDVLVVAHVDDFRACGGQRELQDLKSELQSRFDCGSDMLGPGEHKTKEITFLGRKWRGDKKQVESLIVRAALTPGVSTLDDIQSRHSWCQALSYSRCSRNEL